MQPLTGLRVLDLTWHVAGPYTTKLLADYGASVLKVERPGAGDPCRAFGPFKDDEPNPEASGTFLHLNTNKRGVTLNFKTASGKAITAALVQASDVVVESFSPGVMAAAGLGYDDLRSINPRIIMCSLSTFGQTGPYRDWKATDMTIYAQSGLMGTTGTVEREPLKPADRIMAYQAGATAAVGVMGAALHQRMSGEGQHIDVAVYEVACGSADRRMTYTLGYEYTGENATREGVTPMALPVGNHPSKDGFSAWTVSPTARWTRFVDLVGANELIGDPRFEDPTIWSKLETKEEMDALFYPWILERTKQETMEQAQAKRLAVTPVNQPADVLVDRHLEERGFFVEGEHPVAGRLRYPGAALLLDGEGFELKRTAPLLGHHNEEVYLGELGLSRGDLAIIRAEGTI